VYVNLIRVTHITFIIQRFFPHGISLPEILGERIQFKRPTEAY
jgi:hypothetical protein